MKLITKLGLLLIALSVTAPGFAAKDPKINAIKARQAQMQLRAFNVGPLFGDELFELKQSSLNKAILLSDGLH